MRVLDVGDWMIYEVPFNQSIFGYRIPIDITVP